ncbi:MAG: DUF4372 domain-containing protein [Pyrinomonadaceae bacterium]
MTNITLFSQIIGKLDRIRFGELVAARQTDKHEKGCNSWTHLASMLPMPICRAEESCRIFIRTRWKTCLRSFF